MAFGARLDRDPEARSRLWMIFFFFFFFFFLYFLFLAARQARPGERRTTHMLREEWPGAVGPVTREHRSPRVSRVLGLGLEIFISSLNDVSLTSTPSVLTCPDER